MARTKKSEVNKETVDRSSMNSDWLEAHPVGAVEPVEDKQPEPEVELEPEVEAEPEVEEKESEEKLENADEDPKEDFSDEKADEEEE